MTQAVFHIIFALLIAEFIREYCVKNKYQFSIMYVFICGLAAILPDIDVVAHWVLYFFGFALNEVHRTFTHTLFIPLIFVLAALFIWNLKYKELGKRHLKLHIIFLMIALGTFTHLFLDATVAGVIRPFYPFSNYSIGLNLIGFLPPALQQLALPCLDAAIFILWLVWLEVHHKISNFI